MPQALISTIFISLSLIFTACSQTDKNIHKVKPKVKHHVETTLVVKHEINKTIDTELDTKLAKVEISLTNREIMVNEIKEVWELFFKDYNIKQTDPRRAHFDEYSNYIANSIIMFQNNDININGHISRLPKHRSVHLVIATVITKESSVNHTVIGAAPRFEVGLMQIWGVALNGYNPDTVRKNPELGVILGIRWMTHMLSQCKTYRMKEDKEGWRNTDWLGPLTMYGAKPKNVWKDRKKKICKVFPHAKERVELLNMYETRIDAKYQQDLLLQ